MIDQCEYDRLINKYVIAYPITRDDLRQAIPAAMIFGDLERSIKRAAETLALGYLSCDVYNMFAMGKL